MKWNNACRIAKNFGTSLHILEHHATQPYICTIFHHYILSYTYTSRHKYILAYLDIAHDIATAAYHRIVTNFVIMTYRCGEDAHKIAHRTIARQFGIREHNQSPPHNEQMD